MKKILTPKKRINNIRIEQHPVRMKVPQLDHCQFPVVQTDSHQMHRHHHQQKHKLCATSLQKHPLSVSQAVQIHMLDSAHHLCSLVHTLRDNENNKTNVRLHFVV